MAYIYQIKNKINGKVYIGKTEFSIEKRFKEHCKDAFRERNEKRPLYAAMRKYGIENFEVSLLEETNNPNERETFWIEHFESFKNGYNATLGGDGKRYLDYRLIITTYNNIKNIAKVAKLLQISESSIYNILKQNDIDVKSSQSISKEINSKPIAMLNKDNQEIIQIFTSGQDACRYLIDNKITSSTALNGVHSHIRAVCQGKRKTAYGYIWKYLNEY